MRQILLLLRTFVNLSTTIRMCASHVCVCMHDVSGFGYVVRCFWACSKLEHHQQNLKQKLFEKCNLYDRKIFLKICNDFGMKEGTEWHQIEEKIGNEKIVCTVPIRRFRTCECERRNTKCELCSIDAS